MIIEAILNRLRGTGKIISFINGNIIYALYIGLVIGLIVHFTGASMLFDKIGFILNNEQYIFQNTPIINNILIVFITIALYIIGEASGWGKWVGSLCHPENVTNAVKSETKSGVFFAIHSIANYFIPQNINYFWYCRLALTLRGIYWWLPLYLFFAFVGLISYVGALVIGLLLGVAFPIACELGRRWDFTFNWKFFHTSKGWCNQELIYGAFQGIAMWYVILN